MLSSSQQKQRPRRRVQFVFAVLGILPTPAAVADQIRGLLLGQLGVKPRTEYVIGHGRVGVE